MSTAIVRTPKKGDRVAVAYPAKTAERSYVHPDGGPVYFGQAVTGEVLSGPDPDGDYLVRAATVDPYAADCGIRPGSLLAQYVSASYLTVITEEA